MMTEPKKHASFRAVGRIAGINLAVFFLQFGLLYGLTAAVEWEEIFIPLAANLLLYILPAQFLVNLILAIRHFRQGEKATGIAHLLSVLLVILIGYSACGGYGLMI